MIIYFYGMNTVWLFALSVMILPANGAPDITNLPATIDIIESKTASIATADILFTLAVTDNETFTCNVQSTTPAPTVPAFIVNDDSGTFNVYLAKNPGFEYDTVSSYTVIIACTNALPETASATLTVDLTPNTPPTFTVLPVTKSLPETSPIGTIVETLTVTDTDDFTCIITSQNPNLGIFNMVEVGTNHEIRLASSLDASANSAHTLTITCQDDWGSTTETLYVTVLANTPPAFTGLPGSVSVNEHDTGGSSIYTIAVTDSDSFTCSIATTPTTSAFLIDTANKINLIAGHGLDFDTQNIYTITITCRDATGSSTATLTVNVQQNTAPVITNLPVIESVEQTIAVGAYITTITVTDVETDTVTCVIVSQTPNTETFILQFNTPNYEVHLNKALDPVTYTIDITCSDDWGSTTKTLSVSVAPNQPPSFTGFPASITVNEADAGGNIIYAIGVTDSDTFTCSISTTPTTPTTSTFQIDTTTNKINLGSGHGLDFDTQNSYTITITCADATGSSTEHLTVNVLQNSPPDITNLPDSGSFTTGTTTKTKLHDLTVTDPENDVITCTMSSTPVGPFILEKNTAYELYVNANPTFSASTYAIDIQCSDAYGSTTETYTLSVTPNSDPVITGMPLTVTVSETETASRTIHTIAVTDAESHTISCSLVSVPAGPFSINDNPATPLYEVVLDVNAIDSLDGITTPSHTVTVTCQDTAGGTTTGVLTVDVTPNLAPTVDNLPDHFEVSENQVVELEIWNLAYTDPESDTPVTCVIVTDPAGGPFDLRESGTPNDYRLWVTANPNFNYSGVPTHTVTFTCTDHHNGRTGRSSSGILFVDILENRPPIFTSANSHTQNAQSTPVNTKIFTCATTDADSDTVTYSMTVNPPTSSFTMDPVTCDIWTTQDLKKELNSFYTVTITAEDGKITTIQDLGLTLTNVNTAPEITNIGLNQAVKVYFDETTATNTLLYSPVVYDPDTGQTQTITYTVFPTGEVGTFDVSTSEIRLKNGKTFDYEYINLYKLTMYVTDSYATTGPYYLDVHINNIPEVCGFDKTVYEASTYEAGVSGGRMNIGFTLSDEDDPDYHTFSLVTNPHSQYYKIDQYTGEISFKTDYDIDTCGFVHPKNATIIVQCTDQYGETGTATVSVYVQDVNDNKPICNNTGNVMIVTQYTNPGAFIGSIAASDCDTGVNAVLEYSGASVTGSPYYTVTANGNVYLTNTIDFDYGTDHTFLIKVKDNGIPQLTGTCQLTVIYIWTTTTTTTTVASNIPTDWWDKPENIALVAILSLLALFLLGLLLYLCCRRGLPCRSCTNPFKSCKKCCKPRQPTRRIVTPKDPKKDPFKFFDHNDLNVKRDMFSTRDQVSDAPIPMKM
ncbi:protocadherin Fat 4-like [Mytilus trossulus]|uniref:protocadherin Fat 4-like n=1 Tax=Mytilus trossulus TaxID=6551 RepID=UPI003004E016